MFKLHHLALIAGGMVGFAVGNFLPKTPYASVVLGVIGIIAIKYINQELNKNAPHKLL